MRTFASAKRIIPPYEAGVKSFFQTQLFPNGLFQTVLFLIPEKGRRQTFSLKLKADISPGTKAS
ncbi:MAG: hypothetical protein IKI42_04290, partial [Clostridia bacterium]|nr:hypothetical protein [Clostridia bacterium]